MHTFESCQSLFPMRILELASSSYKLMRLATTLASAFVFLSKDLIRKMLDALPSFSSCMIIAEQSSFFPLSTALQLYFLFGKNSFVIHYCCLCQAAVVNSLEFLIIPSFFYISLLFAAFLLIVKNDKWTGPDGFNRKPS